MTRIHKEVLNGKYEGNNEVICKQKLTVKHLSFRGDNNKLVINGTPTLDKVQIEFDCNNALIEINQANFSARIRVGEDCKVRIGKGLTTTSSVFITTAEGASIDIGEDVMIASSVLIRGEDSHAIFDVISEKRVNITKDIKIGNHVWLGERSTVLGGTIIKKGSVVALGAIVKGFVPNNCIVAGVPSKVVKTNIAWERPHLTYTKPYYKNSSSDIKKSIYWEKTVFDQKNDAKNKLLNSQRRINLSFFKKIKKKRFHFLKFIFYAVKTHRFNVKLG